MDDSNVRHKLRMSYIAIKKSDLTTFENSHVVYFMFASFTFQIQCNIIEDTW